MKSGFIGLIVILISALILALLYALTTRLAKSTAPQEVQSVTSPQGIQKTQDVVDKFQQKSIERQSQEIE